jgi:hypothetical protein
MFFNEVTGLDEWVIEKNTGISVYAVGSIKNPDNNPIWNHKERTTKKLRFSSAEKVHEDKSCITFKRMFKGSDWYLKINKVV